MQKSNWFKEGSVDVKPGECWQCYCPIDIAKIMNWFLKAAQGAKFCNYIN